VKKTYRTPNHQDQKKKYPQTHNNQSTQHTEERILKAAKEKKDKSHIRENQLE
jgi:hypothetical protein